MEKKNIEVIYDKEEDILSLFVNSKKSKFSFDIELPKGDIIVDFGFNGEVVGLEFFNASEYFSFLRKVKSSKLKGKLNAQYGSNWVQIFYELSAPGIKKTISNSLISPYNKEIIVKR